MRVKVGWKASISYQCDVCSFESRSFVELELLGKKTSQPAAEMLSPLEAW